MEIIFNSRAGIKSNYKIFLIESSYIDQTRFPYQLYICPNHKQVIYTDTHHLFNKISTYDKKENIQKECFQTI